MAEKISTIIIKVDLECHRCYKKIRKTLCKLQERENIQTIAYDEKNNKVTISGPFDPKKLSKKLCCKASKVIKDIEIVENKEKPKEKEKPKDAKPADKEKPKPAEAPKPKPAEPEKPKEKEKEKEKPKAAAEPAKADKEKPKPAGDDKSKPDKEKLTPQPKPDLPKADPAWPYPVQAPVYYPGWPDGPACGCGPWYEAYYGGVRCLSCGKTYGWVAGGPSGDPYKPCHFFSEEDPSSGCNIM